MQSIRLIYLIIGLCLLAAVPATAMTPAQKKEAIDHISASAGKIKSMRCSFTQTKNLSMLADKVTSSGVLLYSHPGRLRWEYKSPYKYLFIFNGEKVHIGSKSKKETIDVRKNKVYREVARIMMSTITGQVLSGSSDFICDISGTPASWIVTMTPKKKELKLIFKKIELTFNRNDSTVSGIKIYEKNGDTTDLKFSDISINPAINETVFAIP